jgi:hypothetical protein
MVVTNCLSKVFIIIDMAADVMKHVFCAQYLVCSYRALGTTRASLRSALDCLLKVERGNRYQALH